MGLTSSILQQVPHSLPVLVISLAVIGVVSYFRLVTSKKVRKSFPVNLNYAGRCEYISNKSGLFMRVGFILKQKIYDGKIFSLSLGNTFYKTE